MESDDGGVAVFFHKRLVEDIDMLVFEQVGLLESLPPSNGGLSICAAHNDGRPSSSIASLADKLDHIGLFEKGLLQTLAIVLLQGIIQSL